MVINEGGGLKRGYDKGIHCIMGAFMAVIVW
jgi:hypothetical protein